MEKLKFKTGDIVYLKSGSPRIVVTHIIGGKVWLAFFNDKTGCINVNTFDEDIADQILVHRKEEGEF